MTVKYWWPLILSILLFYCVIGDIVIHWWLTLFIHYSYSEAIDILDAVIYSDDDIESGSTCYCVWWWWVLLTIHSDDIVLTILTCYSMKLSSLFLIRHCFYCWLHWLMTLCWYLKAHLVEAAVGWSGQWLQHGVGMEDWLCSLFPGLTWLLWYCDE